VTSPATRSGRGLRWVATLATLLLMISLEAAPASAQIGLLQGLSHQRTLMGSPRLLGGEDAQVRVTLDGAYRTADFDAEAQRREREALLRQVLLDTDVTFGYGPRLEVGARFGLSYWRGDDSERLGFDYAGVLGKVRLSGQESRWQTAIGFALGKAFRAPGEAAVEVAALAGLDVAPPSLELDGQVSFFASLPEQNDNTFGMGLALGPLWRPVERLALSLDVAGQLSQWVEDNDRLTWSVETALRLGVDLGRGHELALSGRRVLIGARVEEQTAAVLTWRLVWSTAGGLLRLDDEGGPSPEPAEWEQPQEGGGRR
jgi:hypothetical protein